MTRSATGRRRKEALQGWMLLVPALAIMLVFTVYPVFRSVYLSLFKYRMGKVPEYIALENYTYLFGNSTFWKVMRNTVSFALMTVIPSMALGLGLAMLVVYLPFVLDMLMYTREGAILGPVRKLLGG